jgi:hypothetical protein
MWCEDDPDALAYMSKARLCIWRGSSSGSATGGGGEAKDVLPEETQPWCVVGLCPP